MSTTRFVAVLLLAASVVALAGCSLSHPDEPNPDGPGYVAVDGPVGDLYRFCFESGADPVDFTFNALLYFDQAAESVVPPPYSKIVLANSTDRAGLWNRLELYVEGLDEPLPEESLPPISQQGWKVRVSGARVDTCDVCYLGNGLLLILSLHADSDLVEFEYDPADSLDAFVVPVEILD